MDALLFNINAFDTAVDEAEVDAIMARHVDRAATLVHFLLITPFTAFTPTLLLDWATRNSHVHILRLVRRGVVVASFSGLVLRWVRVRKINGVFWG